MVERLKSVFTNPHRQAVCGTQTYPPSSLSPYDHELLSNSLGRPQESLTGPLPSAFPWCRQALLCI